MGRGEGARVKNHTDRRDRRLERGPQNRQRERVLRLVREHGSPIDAVELAGRMGLHVTTVRFHLDALCDQGAITRTRITRTGVGRPRTGYIAVQDRLDYQSFAEILALELGKTTETRRRRAQHAGRRWADRIAAASVIESIAEQDVSDADEPGEILDRQAAMTAHIFEQMGFAPQLTPPAERTAGKAQRTIRLHGCPVRDLARAHPEVGCAMHLGLLQGLLTKSAGGHGYSRAAARPALRAELEPFVQPELCIARVIAGD
jgi:predicted ArsR family transcriptional regulator